MENGELWGHRKTEVFWGIEGECERSEPGIYFETKYVLGKMENGK
jgi:hypothetical protein